MGGAGGASERRALAGGREELWSKTAFRTMAYIPQHKKDAGDTEKEGGAPKPKKKNHAFFASWLAA